MTEIVADQNLLPRPPRLKPDGSGYDWREFDRYLQKVYTMLGLFVESKVYNVPNEISSLQSSSLSAYEKSEVNIEGLVEDGFLKQASLHSEPTQPKQNILIENLATAQGENPTWENRIKALELGSSWPVGSIFISIVATNPATLLGFGTWTAFGAGRVLIGLDAGDADFDTPEETGGAKTHLHSVDVGSKTSGLPSLTVNAVTAGGTVAVGTGLHPHDTDPDAVNSAMVSNVPPYIVVYMWKRVS